MKKKKSTEEMKVLKRRGKKEDKGGKGDKEEKGKIHGAYCKSSMLFNEVKY